MFDLILYDSQKFNKAGKSELHPFLGINTEQGGNFLCSLSHSFSVQVCRFLSPKRVACDDVMRCCVVIPV